MSVTKKILEYIKQKNLTQTELSARTLISQQNLNRILNSNEIKVSTLIKISKALNVPPSFFFDGKEHLDNTEIEAYKKQIRSLEEQVNSYKFIRTEKFLNEVNSILEYDFKDVPIEIREKVKEEFETGINNYNSFIKKQIDDMRMELSQITKKEIKKSIYEQIQAHLKKKS